MKAFRKRVFAGVAAVTILLVVAVFLSSTRALAWAPDSLVRARLLASTPRGTDQRSVQNYLMNSSFAIVESGGYVRRPVPGYPVEGTYADYMKVAIGRYRLLFRTDVEAVYTFDDHRKLTDIIVKRYTDSP